MRRRTKWILFVPIVIIVTLLGIGLLPNVLPATEYVRGVYCYCTECGMRRYAYEEGRIGSSAPLKIENEQFEETSLSQWYKEHFPQRCQHAWQVYHGSGTHFFHYGPFRVQKKAYTRGGNSPEICSLNGADRVILEKLFSQDPINCRNYIRLRLAPEHGKYYVDSATDRATIERGLLEHGLTVTPHAPGTPASSADQGPR